MHKEPEDNPPGCPLLRVMAHLLNQHLNILITLLNLQSKNLSFIEGTTDVLNGLATLNNIHSHYLVTMDIESLYTSIDHQEGLLASKHFPTNRSDLVPSSDFLLKLTDWVIHNNVF